MLHAKKPTSYWFGDSSELITSFFSQAAPVLASSFPTEVPAASWGHHQWHPTQNAAEEQWPLVARGLWPGFSVVSVVFPVLRNGIWTENQKIQIDPNLMFFRCRCERYRSCTRQHVSWHSRHSWHISTCFKQRFRLKNSANRPWELHFFDGFQCILVQGLWRQPRPRDMSYRYCMTYNESMFLTSHENQYIKHYKAK